MRLLPAAVRLCLTTLMQTTMHDARLRRCRERWTLGFTALIFVFGIFGSAIWSGMQMWSFMYPMPNPCDAFLTSLANKMMLPYHHEFPTNYVNRTGLSTELAEIVERSRAPSEIRLIVGLGRRQVGKASVVLEQFTRPTCTTIVCSEAHAMQLGLDLDHVCGSQHAHKGHMQRIISQVYEEPAEHHRHPPRCRGC